MCKNLLKYRHLVRLMRSGSQLPQPLLLKTRCARISGRAERSLRRGFEPLSKPLSPHSVGYLINPNPSFLRPCGSKRAELESRKKGLQSLLQTSSLLSDARPQTRLGKARASSALLSLLLRFKGTRLNLLRGKTALRKDFGMNHEAFALKGDS